MLDRKFRKSGLDSYKYHKTQWYQAIRNDIRSYRRLMMLWLLGLFLIIPVVTGAIALMQRDWIALGIRLTLFAILVAETVLISRCKRTRHMIIMCLVQLILALMVSPFLSWGAFLSFFSCPSIP